MKNYSRPVPLQSKGISGKQNFVDIPTETFPDSAPVFAYTRRSTKKAEQAESLKQQSDGVGIIARHLGTTIPDEHFFSESRSGFENKKRPEWEKMLKLIDKGKVPATLMVRDISRLSRNPKDSLEITNRLYGDNGSKRSIGKIVFLDYSGISEWTKNSDKQLVSNRLHASYLESLETKRKSLQGFLLKLAGGEYPYSAPNGLEKDTSQGLPILKQGAKMRYVRRAFEMKAAGDSLEKIVKYLHLHGIKTAKGDITQTFFQNTVYIGQYTEKNTGKAFNIRFLEGTPPIPQSLWDRVQDRLGRKNSKYGLGQSGDVIANFLRTSDGKRMTGYYPSGKTARQYTNNRAKIRVSEAKILDEFLKKVAELLSAFYEESDEKLMKDTYRVFGCRIDGTEQDSYYILLDENNEGYIDVHPEKTPKARTRKKLQELISERVESLSNEREEREASIQLLQAEIQRTEEQMKAYRKNAFIGGANVEEVQEVCNEFQKKTKIIENQISELSESTASEEFLARIPELLEKTFELSCNTICKEKTEVSKDDILKLLEFITVELTINDKKELYIELFGVLENLVKYGSI